MPVIRLVLALLADLPSGGHVKRDGGAANAGCKRRGQEFSRFFGNPPNGDARNSRRKQLSIRRVWKAAAVDAPVFECEPILVRDRHLKAPLILMVEPNGR